MAANTESYDEMLPIFSLLSLIVWASAKVQMFVAKLTNVLQIYLANASPL